MPVVAVDVAKVFVFERRVTLFALLSVPDAVPAKWLWPGSVSVWVCETTTASAEPPVAFPA